MVIHIASGISVHLVIAVEIFDGHGVSHGVGDWASLFQPRSSNTVHDQANDMELAREG